MLVLMKMEEFIIFDNEGLDSWPPIRLCQTHMGIDTVFCRNPMFDRGIGEKHAIEASDFHSISSL